MLPAQDRVIDDYYVIDALLRHNFLPCQKGLGEELPPAFSSTSFSLNAAEALGDVSLRKNGYDCLSYCMTRPDQSDRKLSIPHPLAHAHTAIQIASEWERLEVVTENKNSHIKPSFNGDGRVIVMNYDDQALEKLDRELEASLGKSFCVRADIRQCFSSIPLNIFSILESKFEPIRLNGKKISFRNRWFYKLERSLSLSNCNKPTGLPIGPASSNVIAEFLLGEIDKTLLANGFSFDRYIDDYVCYCDTHLEAESFLMCLRGALQEYGLEINEGKTGIAKMPQPLSPDWLIDLQASLPAKKYDKYYYSVTEALRYLDFALRLQEQIPEKSILKFAVKSVIQHVEKHDAECIYKYVLNLSRYYPSLLPLLRDLPSAMNDFEKQESIRKLLLRVVQESAERRCSDGMVWGLYYLSELSCELDDVLVSKVLNTKDPLALLSLHAYRFETEGVLSILSEILEQDDLWAIDRYWMIFYQFYLEGILPNPYPQDNVFEILRYYDVCFIKTK